MKCYVGLPLTCFPPFKIYFTSISGGRGEGSHGRDFFIILCIKLAFSWMDCKCSSIDRFPSLFLFFFLLADQQGVPPCAPP